MESSIQRLPNNLEGVLTLVQQEEQIVIPKQHGEISESCVVDLIQIVEESYMLPNAEKEDFPYLMRRKFN